MLYHVQYYDLGNKYNPIQYQMSKSIRVKVWQQIGNLSVGDMIDNWNDKNISLGYEPCFIFIKYENLEEKEILEHNFSHAIVDTKKFNIHKTTYSNNSNIIVIDCDH